MSGDRHIAVPDFVSRAFDSRLSIALCERELGSVLFDTLAKWLQVTEAAKVR